MDGSRVFIAIVSVAFLFAFGYVVYCGRHVRLATTENRKLNLQHHQDSLIWLAGAATLLIVSVLMVTGGKISYAYVLYWFHGGPSVPTEVMGSSKIAYVPTLFWFHEGSNLTLIGTIVGALLFNGARAPQIHRKLMPPMICSLCITAVTGGILLWQL